MISFIYHGLFVRKKILESYLLDGQLYDSDRPYFDLDTYTIIDSQAYLCRYRYRGYYQIYCQGEIFIYPLMIKIKNKNFIINPGRNYLGYRIISYQKPDGSFVEKQIDGNYFINGVRFKTKENCLQVYL